MKTMVVTGAGGFLGSNLVAHLVNKGVRVIAIDLPACDGRLPKNDMVEFIACDLAKLDNLHLELSQVDALYHFAWRGVAPEFRNDIDCQKANIDLCLAAVRLAARTGAKRFILPGSTMEYSYSDGPINRSSLPTPQNAYGSTKVACRFLTESSCKAHGIEFMYAVITSIYGVGREDNNVIFYVLKELLAGRKPSVTALTQKWDFVHISDAVEALALIGEKGKAGAFYSIGAGENRPLFEYVFRIRDLINPSLPLGIGEVPYASNRIPHSMMDISCLTADTGYLPKVRFDQGIVSVVEHYTKKSGAN